MKSKNSLQMPHKKKQDQQHKNKRKSSNYYNNTLCMNKRLEAQGINGYEEMQCVAPSQ